MPETKTAKGRKWRDKRKKDSNKPNSEINATNKPTIDKKKRKKRKKREEKKRARIEMEKRKRSEKGRRKLQMKSNSRRSELLFTCN